MGDDWRTVWWNKVNWLERASALVPWWRVAAGSSPPPPPPPPTAAPTPPATTTPPVTTKPPSPPPATTTPPATTKPATPPPTTTPPKTTVRVLMRMKGREREEGEEKEEAKTRIKNFTPLSLFLLKNKQTNKQTQVPPSTSTPKPTSAPTPPPSNSSFICSATITASSWQSGLLYYAALNIALTSPKVQTPLPYPVSLRIARAVTVDSAWNWSPAKVPTAGWVTGKVSESWQAMGEGKPAGLGLIVAGSAADLRPTAVSVSGSFCTVAYA